MKTYRTVMGTSKIPFLKICLPHISRAEHYNSNIKNISIVLFNIP